MFRLFTVLLVSVFMAGCDALWEDDNTELPEPTAAASVSGEASAPAMSVNASDNSTKPAVEAPVAVPSVAISTPVIAAPKDPSKARIIEVRESLGLVAFVRSEAVAVKSLLQLFKDGKVLVVEVVSVNGTQVVANIVPGQKNGAQLAESDIVGVSQQGSATGP